jgi:4-aminobutyrate aminotransferase / (S)-3-amino-2-methylpropionate transaminase / 5-aminovalerate transaminase
LVVGLELAALTTVANDQGPTTTYQRLKQETKMATIQLRTAIPGPKSKALAERRAEAIPRGLSIGTPVYVAKAEDAWLEDVDGNRYLDFAGGIGCLNVGHRREPVVSAVKAQLDRFLHTCVQVTPY